MKGLTLSERQLYEAWIEDRVEDYKAGLSREALMDLAEQAVQELFDQQDQYPLTEIVLRDAVDHLIRRRLRLPGFRAWVRKHRAGLGS
jgi:hypothetical protein